MFARYLESSFWHFYDSLGLYTVLTIVFEILVLAVGSAMELVSPVGLPVFVVAAVILLLLVCVSSAAQNYFCREELAYRGKRYSTVWVGIKKFSLTYLLFIGCYLGINAILIVNTVFYFSIGNSGQYTLVMFCLFALMLFIAIMFNILSLIAFSLPVYCKENNLRAKDIVRLTLQSFFIWPTFWFFVAIFVALISLLLIVSIVGIPMIITLFSVTSSVGFDCTLKKNEKLIAARDLLGVDVSVSVLKKKAEQLAADDYMNTNKRSFRELLKPWE